MKWKGRRPSRNVEDIRNRSIDDSVQTRSQLDMAFNGGKKTKAYTKQINTSGNSLRQKGYEILSQGSKALKSAAPKTAKGISKLKKGK